jgi:hypothetical protein
VQLQSGATERRYLSPLTTQFDWRSVGFDPKLLLMARQTKLSFEERLAKIAADARERAQLLPACKERDELLSRAQKCDTALRINAWMTSPGLRPPE